MEKILIIVRHAHREVINPLEDNGLSEKGHKQARKILKHFKSSCGKVPITLMSSPRTRCQETIEPIAEFLKQKITISNDLDEGAQTKFGRLEKRIEDFKKWCIERAPEMTLICSHGDWIPAFFEHTIGQALELKKAGWATLHVNGNRFSLAEAIQHWDAL
jgi:broad specificity phosphatase PhoE